MIISRTLLKFKLDYVNSGKKNLLMNSSVKIHFIREALGQSRWKVNFNEFYEKIFLINLMRSLYSFMRKLFLFSFPRRKMRILW